MKHSERVRAFLRTSPDADEARRVIALVARGQPPPYAMSLYDARGTSLALMEKSRRCIWWHYERGRVVIDDIGDP